MRSSTRFKAMNVIHRILLSASGGRLGWTAEGMPVLELTTTGRKSGQPHSVMLTSPLQEGAAIIVVASGGGDRTPPAWFLNVRDSPAVGVRLQGNPKRQMRGWVATPAVRERLWPRVIAEHHNDAYYQSRTTREIAPVLLEPVG
jgi:deazaflavin-dependent oxidoreductase (nitroreductase family)